MATYKQIKGVTVQTKGGDPDVFAGVWSSGGDINRNSRQFGSFGTLTAGVIAGGAPGTVPSSAEVEEYNGTSWSEVNNMPSGSFALAASRNAPQTNAIVFGGVNEANTGMRAEADSYDGTNWTEVAEMNTARRQLGGSGDSSTAALAFGGDAPPGTDAVELWNGSTWAETTEINTARANMGCFGTSTAAISAAGTDPVTTAVEQWNGSSWTEIAELNTERARSGGTGTTTEGLIISGGPPNTAKTENWNGSTWTEIADVATARHEAGSGGTGTAAFIAGGYSTTTVASTEEFTFPDGEFGFLTEGDIFLSKGTGLKGFQKGSGVPTGSFSSGGALNTARYTLGGCGNSTAAIAAGGDFYVGPPNSPSDRSGTNTESYNGTSWTEVNEMNNDVQGTASMAGTQTAGIANASPNSPKAYIESWDGTSWTNAPDINTNRYQAMQAAQGSQTASLLVGGGNPPGVVANVEEWNGSAWTEVTDINTARSEGRNTGSSSAQIFFGGYVGPPTSAANESWNGTTWTELNDLPVARQVHSGIGSQTIAVTTHGGGPNSLGAPNPTGPNSSKAINFWNGTSWSADADDAPYKARGVGCGGSATDGIVFGGISDPNFTLTTTIEWNVDAVIGTITVS